LARLQGERRILLKGGVVLTLDRQVGDFARADVLIENGKISTVRPDIATPGEATAVIDAENHILIPGFVDTHSHSYQGILRGIMTNGVLDPDYNRDVQTKLTPAFQPADVYAGVLTTALGLIDMGTTAIIDLSQISHTPEHSDACIRALQDSGIRAVYAYARGLGPATLYPQDILRLQRTYFSTKDQLLTLALGVGLDAKIFAIAREAGVPAVLHMRNDSAGLLALGRAGLLQPGDEYIHCTNLSDDAWQLIKDTGGRVSLCPQIEMSMGHGRPAVQEALDHGLRPSLSSDHGVTIAPDFFTVMRSVFMFQRMQVFARARSGAPNLPRRRRHLAHLVEDRLHMLLLQTDERPIAEALAIRADAVAKAVKYPALFAGGGFRFALAVAPIGDEGRRRQIFGDRRTDAAGNGVALADHERCRRAHRLGGGVGGGEAGIGDVRQADVGTAVAGPVVVAIDAFRDVLDDEPYVVHHRSDRAAGRRRLFVGGSDRAAARWRASRPGATIHTAGVGAAHAGEDLLVGRSAANSLPFNNHEQVSGYLPRPWTGMASSQCRPCHP